MRRFSQAHRRQRLAIRHHLARPAASVEEAAAALVGLHSSDPATVFLSAWARLDGFSVGDLERAMYDDRTLVRIPGMRRTLFVVPTPTAPTIARACTSRYARRERTRLVEMLESQGVAEDGEAWLDGTSAAVSDALREGPATGAQLSRRIPAMAEKLTFGEGKTWGGEIGVSTRVLFVMTAEGLIVRGRPKGTWLSSQYRWEATRPASAGLAREGDSAARRDLLETWLRTFGPATLTDIKWWMGWTIRDSRKAVADSGAVEVGLEQGTGYALADDLEDDEDPGDWVALLPSLDPTVMGWKERDWYLGPHGEALFDRNGNAGPTVWSNGEVIGGWGQARNGEVVWRLLEDRGSATADRIAARAAKLTKWLDGTVVTPRFQSPLGAELAG